MNYEQPRQRQDDKRWDYTNRNDDRIYPIGYCQAFRELDDPPGVIQASQEQIEEHRKFKDKYHTNGHATYEEACNCYKEYLLDHRLKDYHSKHEQHKCQVCGEWTDGGMEIGCYEIFYLCNKHANREEVEKVFTVGECIHS